MNVEIIKGRSATADRPFSISLRHQMIPISVVSGRAAGVGSELLIKRAQRLKTASFSDLDDRIL
ncbi:hypothetical protein QFZ80_002679 [Paenibacillus sp. V4I7]|nr:hypothetical protein [Paenibacillus sp. V4I7]